MDREREQSSSEEKKVADEAEKNRRQMDEIPEPGTDPLHEGP